MPLIGLLAERVGLEPCWRFGRVVTSYNSVRVGLGEVSTARLWQLLPAFGWLVPVIAVSGANY